MKNKDTNMCNKIKEVCSSYVLGDPLAYHRISEDEFMQKIEAYLKKYNQAHQDLLTIHKITQCVNDVEPIHDTDTATVRNVKSLAHHYNQLTDKLVTQ